MSRCTVLASNCLSPPILSFCGLATDRRIRFQVALTLYWVLAQATAFCVTLDFAGRTWNIKQSNTPVGPGPNRFSALASDVWSDAQGLHLTIHKHGAFWYSTEVILTESLGYGTYVVQTNSRQDILNPNATFGAFTWDSFGDDQEIPAFPNREIDIEDSRWGDPDSPTNSQFVVQPYFVPGNLVRYTLPDLSGDSELTRVIRWYADRVEFLAIAGHRHPDDYSPSELIYSYTYVEDYSMNHKIPDPSRENFRFNLWLNESAPLNNIPVEVVVSDFQFIPQDTADFDADYDVDGNDFLIWQRGFGSGSSISQGDANRDNIVDGADLAIWQQQYNLSGNISTIVQVPEPSSAGVLYLIHLGTFWSLLNRSIRMSR